MSQPEPSPEIPVEFAASLRGVTPYTGSKLVTEAEWKEACECDPFLLKILDYIEQDRAYIKLIKHEINEAMRPIRAMRTRVKLSHLRIQARKRQHKHFAALLRKRLAWDKIDQIRKETGLS